jgi:hypothetical protein
MDPGERIDLGFQVQARYPVKGKGGVSQVYAYYTPEWQGTTVDPAVIVR